MRKNQLVNLFIPLTKDKRLRRSSGASEQKKTISPPIAGDRLFNIIT
ncbi:hypothetical protein [Paenibacillus sp. N3.4]|nr:hypothetical protein [Paenibacillus sp. N3.4]